MNIQTQRLEELRQRMLSNVKTEIITKNKFRGSGVIPLGTERPFWDYPDGKVPEDEVITIPYRPREPMHVAIIAKTGYLKTVMLKNIMYHAHHQNAQVVFFDNKGRDSALISQKGTGVMLPQYIEPDSLPAKVHIPATISRFFDLLPPYIKKNSELFALSLKKILASDYARIYFKTLGISPLVIEKMIDWGKKTGSIQKMFDMILREKTSWMAKDSAASRLINVKNDMLFSTDKYPLADINDDWDEDLISVFAFMEQDVRYSQFLAASVLEDIFRRSTTNKTRREAKMIIVDDADLLAPAYKDEGDVLSLKFLKEGVTKWRDLHAQFCFATQSPELLHSSILGNCKYYIFGRMSNPDAIKPYVSDTSLIWQVRSLRYNVGARLYQYMLVHEDGVNYTLFYPFSSICGHTF